MEIIEIADVKRILREDGTADAIITRKDGSCIVLGNVITIASGVDRETAERIATAPRTNTPN